LTFRLSWSKEESWTTSMPEVRISWKLSEIQRSPKPAQCQHMFTNRVNLVATF
jgi:hypothetical protein